MRSQILIGSMLAAASSLLLAGCGSSPAAESKETEGPAAGGARPGLVRVAAAELRTVAPRVFAVGTIVPRRTSIVASGADGVVIGFHVEDGQYVEEGVELSELLMKSTDLEIAEAGATLLERQQHWQALQKTHPASVAEAQARLNAAETVARFATRKLERAENLYAQDAFNKENLDDALQTAEAARESLAAARSALEAVVHSAEIEQARARYESQKEHVAWLEAEKEKRTTRAPFNGYVVEEHSYVGQWLSKGDPIVTLAKLDEVEVVVNIDQWDLRHVQLGETVDVRIRGVEPSDWKGQVAAIVPRSDWQSGSRGFPVKVRVDNFVDAVRIEQKNGQIEEQRVPRLNEGMMAEVTFLGQQVETVLVPKDALVRTTHGMNLYVFTAEDPNAPLDPEQAIPGSTRHVAVEVGVSDGSWVQVQPTAGGANADFELKSGMLVVTEGGENLRPPIQSNVQAKGPRDAATATASPGSQNDE